MTDDIDIDRQYSVFQDDQSQMAIDPECMPLVDRALKLWADSRRDTWLSLTGPTGVEYSILASSINSTMLCTADQRASSTARDKALADERDENRRLAGFIESE
jgi:hypothetical protein